VGRGGQALFKDNPNAFHVRIVAPIEKRAEEMMTRTVITREDAVEYLKRRDRAGFMYIKRFYKEDWDDPLLYHMIINTGFMDEDTAALVLADAVKKYFSCKEIPI